MRRTKTTYRKARLRTILWLMVQKYQPQCPLCHEPITEEDLPTKGTDSITEHHWNGDHENNDLINRVLVHRSCHKSYHAKNNINSPERKFWREF